MNLENLGKGAVRSTDRRERTPLSERELKTVVGGFRSTIIGDDSPQPTRPEPVKEPVTPEQCAIHFYYPQDATA